MKNIDFSKFADKFIDDAHNLLNELESKLLELEQSPEDQGMIESVFRAMHTLKGHRSNLLMKTGTKNTAGLIMYAIKNKIIVC